ALDAEPRDAAAHRALPGAGRGDGEPAVRRARAHAEQREPSPGDPAQHGARHGPARGAVRGLPHQRGRLDRARRRLLRPAPRRHERGGAAGIPDRAGAGRV
ncbi:MAG: hypothetical protein AVDCRST_MAG11-3421, partial [uncultured Gemmatimonadaceae bacterium]